MSGIWLPLGLALSSWIGFALGTLPFRIRSSHHDHEIEGEIESSVLGYLYPVTVAFFLGYLATTLVPHAVLGGGKVPVLAFVVGAALMALLSRKVLRRDPCCETGHDHDPIGWTFFLALSVCAVNDGLLIGLLNPPWLSGLNLGMVLHKVTSSFALALALGHWNYRGARLTLLGLANGLISPLLFFIGAGLRGAAGAHGAEVLHLDGVLAFSAGVLVYTVVTGMLPHSRKLMARKPGAWAGFLAALAVSVALGWAHRAMHGG
jgi:zinc transporter ZupT